MLPTSKRWNLPLAIPEEFRPHYAHLNPLLAQILYNRGVIEPDDVTAFLQSAPHFYDPFALKGVPQAVERIRRAIVNGERVVVYGDFDVDGVTSTALLVQTLGALGAEVAPYIPHRVDEGYGLNCEALTKIAGRGVTLVITVDCGIRSAKEVAHANGLGVDMIVTDHHSIARGQDGVQEIPPALTVINPRQDGETYRFRELAGVGIAFKLAQALLRAEEDTPSALRPVTLVETDLLDLVALGTVADVAQLLGENRTLVQRGLIELNRCRRAGVQAMLAEAGLTPGKVNAMSIGFVLGPRLNAAGRLDTAKLSYDLLTAGDALTAKALADQLGRLNRERQTLTQQMVAAAKEQIAKREGERYLYLVSDPGFKPGVVGLVAGRLTEELYRPTLVAERGETTTHGSARSIPEFDITAALDQCRDLLVRHGGHAVAAGFTVENEKLPELEARLESLAAEVLAGQELAPALQIDAWVRLWRLDWATQELLLQLEPCGAANPQPVLASRSLEVVNCRPVGTDGQHIKLRLRDPQAAGGARWVEWDAIAFRQSCWLNNLPPRIDVAYTLERNEYNGERRLQLNVKDIRPAQESAK